MDKPQSSSQDSSDPIGVPKFTARPGSMSLPARALGEGHFDNVPITATDTVLQGRYKVVGVLGKGGFGAVYRVMDTRLPGKFWALKELRFQDKSQLSEAKRSFEQEARMLSTLMHASLPVVVDYFTEDDRTYLLMEEVEGCTLAQLVEDEGPVVEMEALGWALEIAKVLDYLHTQDPPVIFRDIKPENVMITKDRHVKLIDFGLARFFDPDKSRDTTVVGSVGYASPEAWEDSTQTDPRSDIYSFGATLYYVLTGRPPSPVYGTHKIEPYRKDLNPRFSALVLKCMEVLPENRYSSASDIITELISIITASSKADPLLQEELKREAFLRTATKANAKKHNPVEIAKAVAVNGSQRPVEHRAAKTPLWAATLLIAATLAFIVGAFWGYLSVKSNRNWEFDIPYELVNVDKEEARKCLEKGELQKAASLLNLAVTRHPGDAEAHIMQENTSVLLSGGKYVKIPAFMSLTGVDAPEAYRLLYGIAMAQGEFNKERGAKDHRLIVDIYDDCSDIEKIYDIAEKMVNNPDYQVVLGPFSSQRTLAIASFFNAKEMPIITPVVSVPGVWDQGEFIFTASDTNKPRVEAIAKKFFDLGYRKAAVIIDRDSALSNAVAQYFNDSFKHLGGEIATTQTFTDVKFSKAISGIAENNADCVFFSDHRGTVLAYFAKDLKAYGLNLPIASQVAPFTKDLLQIGEGSVEGLWLSGYFHSESDDPKTKKYVERFKNLFGDLAPSHLDASAYDSLCIILDAFKAGVSNRLEMRDYLASIGAVGDKSRPIYQGATGKFSLARMLNCRNVYLIKINQGRYTLIDTIVPPDVK